MTLHHLTANQSGQIRITASKSSSVACLSVLEPPVEFVVGLKDVAQEETTDATFECEVSRARNIGMPCCTTAINSNT